MSANPFLRAGLPSSVPPRRISDAEGLQARIAAIESTVASWTMRLPRDVVARLTAALDDARQAVRDGNRIAIYQERVMLDAAMRDASLVATRCRALDARASGESTANATAPAP